MAVIVVTVVAVVSDNCYSKLLGQQCLLTVVMVMTVVTPKVMAVVPVLTAARG
jgi:hypothetical protein